MHLNLNTQTETFSWVVLGGTGDYAALHGSGQGTTVPGSEPQTGNFNNYAGFLIGSAGRRVCVLGGLTADFYDEDRPRSSVDRAQPS